MIVGAAVIIVDVQMCNSFCQFIDVFFEADVFIQICEPGIEAVADRVEFFAELFNLFQGAGLDAEADVALLRHFDNLPWEVSAVEVFAFGDSEASQVGDDSRVEHFCALNLLLPLFEGGVVVSGTHRDEHLFRGVRKSFPVSPVVFAGV